VRKARETKYDKRLPLPEDDEPFETFRLRCLHVVRRMALVASVPENLRSSHAEVNEHFQKLCFVRMKTHRFV